MKARANGAGTAVDAAAEKKIAAALDVARQATDEDAKMAAWKEALEVGMRAYRPRIQRHLRSMLRDDDQGDEAFAIFGERLVKGIKNFEGKSTFWWWSVRIADNAGRDVANKNKRTPVPTSSSELVALEGKRPGAAALERQHSSTREWLKTAAKEKLRAQVQRLPKPKDRRIAVLRLLERLRFKDVAARLAEETGAAVKTDTVRKRFGRVVTKLAKMMVPLRSR